MIRRKIWATATYCMAVAGAAQAQTGTGPKASLGLPTKEPQTPYVARGVAPNAGYPQYVPRNYTAPAAPGYSGASYAGPPSSGVVSAPVELFAVSADPVPPTTGPAPAAPTVGPLPMTPTAPLPEPMSGGATLTPPAHSYPMPGMPMDMSMGFTPVPINGGPMIGGAPYLDGTPYWGEGSLPTTWISGEYMGWRLKGVATPALVTTAPAGAPGTLDDAATFIPFGNGGDLLENWSNGLRIRAGCWFPDGVSGLDLAFMGTNTFRNKGLFGSNGDQGLFRPFFNTAIRAEDAQLVAFTDPVAGPLFSGRIGTLAEANLWGFEVNYRSGLGMGFGGRLDALIGYRYLSLNDLVQVQSQANTLTQLGPVPAGTLIVTEDRFESFNNFNGGQIGFVGEWAFGAVTFGMRGTVGLGVNTQRVEIGGFSTSLTPNGSSAVALGGLLAQPTNIGTFERTRFAFLPEVGVTMGYQVSNNIRVFGGFNAFYWTNVVRAGEQINRNVNATFIADPTTGTRSPFGAPAPTFHHRDENIWGYGYSLGLELRW